MLIAWQYWSAFRRWKSSADAQLKRSKASRPIRPAHPATNQPAGPSNTVARCRTTGRRTARTQPVHAAPRSADPRETVIAASPRVKIDTPKLSGSISLNGARIDDLALTQYRETVDPKSPPIVLLSPSGSPQPFYAEFGWVPAAGSTVKMPDATRSGRSKARARSASAGR